MKEAHITAVARAEERRQATQPHDATSLSAADDRIRLSAWLPPQQGITPRIRFGGVTRYVATDNVTQARATFFASAFVATTCDTTFFLRFSAGSVSQVLCFQ